MRITAMRPLDFPQQRLTVPALHLPVEIVVYRYGIPHIYVKSVHDLFVAQGLNAARNRLW